MCLLLNVSSEQYSRQKFGNLVKMYPTLKKISVFWNFYCYETKFTDFRGTSDNFLVSIGISYWQSEFLFYLELNAVQCEKAELSQGISRILPIFGEIIMYQWKIIVNLNNMYCKKSPFTGNYAQNLQILPILGELIAYLCKRKTRKKDVHFKNYQ